MGVKSRILKLERDHRLDLASRAREEARSEEVRKKLEACCARAGEDPPDWDEGVRWPPGTDIATMLRAANARVRRKAIEEDRIKSAQPQPQGLQAETPEEAT